MAREPEAPAAPEGALSVEAEPVEEFPTDTIEPEADQARAGQVIRQFTAHAGALSWGPWVHVDTHTTAVTRYIDYQAIEDIVAYGCVYYYPSDATGKRTEVFKDGIQISTKQAHDTIQVCFHGNPEESVVTGRVLAFGSG
jgi:hypothetical protein